MTCEQAVLVKEKELLILPRLDRVKLTSIQGEGESGESTSPCFHCLCWHARSTLKSS